MIEPLNTRASAADIGSQNAACDAAVACTPAAAGAAATMPIADASAIAPANFPFFHLTPRRIGAHPGLFRCAAVAATVAPRESGRRHS